MIQNLLNKSKKKKIEMQIFFILQPMNHKCLKTARMFLGSKLSERYYMGAGN